MTEANEVKARILAGTATNNDIDWARMIEEENPELYWAHVWIRALSGASSIELAMSVLQSEIAMEEEETELQK